MDKIKRLIEARQMVRFLGNCFKGLARTLFAPFCTPPIDTDLINFTEIIYQYKVKKIKND